MRLLLASLLVAALGPLAAQTQGGTFVFIGGGADQDAIMRRFIQLAGNDGRRLLVVPWASDHPAQSGQAYLDDLKRLSAPGGHVLVARPELDEAQRKWLAEARGIFFSGGDQQRILKAMTPSWRQALIASWRNGCVLAGTSAGAMVFGDQAILDGDPLDTAWKGSMKLGSGLGLRHGLVVDTHFTQRGRFPRLAQALAKGAQVTLGVDPETAAVVDANGDLEVIGRGTVTLARHGGTLRAAAPGHPLSLRGLQVDVLATGEHESVSELVESGAW